MEAIKSVGMIGFNTDCFCAFLFYKKRKEGDKTKMKSGTIIAINKERGFGFIIAVNDESKQKIFFHISNLRNIAFEKIKNGDKVSFTEVETEKGLKAINVDVVI